MKYLSDNIYVGVGYYFDHFYNIRALDTVSNSVQRRIVKELGNKETGSGPSFRFLYDSRLNQINPKQGLYYSMTFRTSEKFLGSDSTWSSLQIDSRAYLPFPRESGTYLPFGCLIGSQAMELLLTYYCQAQAGTIVIIPGVAIYKAGFAEEI